MGSEARKPSVHIQQLWCQQLVVQSEGGKKETWGWVGLNAISVQILF